MQEVRNHFHLFITVSRDAQPMLFELTNIESEFFFAGALYKNSNVIVCPRKIRSEVKARWEIDVCVRLLPDPHKSSVGVGLASAPLGTPKDITLTCEQFRDFVSRYGKRDSFSTVYSVSADAFFQHLEEN